MNTTELKRIAEAATPGPWDFERVSFDDGDFAYELNDDDRMIQIHEDSYRDRMKAKFDSAHIATFNPTLCLKLLRDYERMRGVVENCHEEIIRHLSQETVDFKRALEMTHGCLESLELKDE